MKIDTSTTAGKIEVQQAWIDGKNVARKRFDHTSALILAKDFEPLWNWDTYRYSIKPQTVEEAAEAHVGKCASSNGHKERVIDFIAGSNWRSGQDNE